MKLFFRTVISCIIMTAILCCGCAGTGAGRAAQPEDGPGAEDGSEQQLSLTGQGAAGPWQSMDTAMGTVVQQTIYAEDQEAAEDFSRQASDLLSRLEREEISWRLDTSEVYRANASAGSGEGFDLSEDLSVLLEACKELWERSDGAFDATLGAVTRLWNIDSWAVEEDTNDFVPPSEEELKQALSTCGSQRMRLVREELTESGSAAESDLAAIASAPLREENGQAGGCRLYLPEGMRLDLGAVGKGFAMEKLFGLLEDSSDVTAAVISLGGSILTYGSKPDGEPWRVGIVNPFDTSGSIGTLTLAGQWCVSTSGDYERYVEADGVRYHHILDPKTGMPAASDVRGVTILMKDGLLSDGLSTACYILGPEKGMELAGQYGAEALFVMADGRIEMSEGMEPYFTENQNRK